MGGQGVKGPADSTWHLALLFVLRQHRQSRGQAAVSSVTNIRVVSFPPRAVTTCPATPGSAVITPNDQHALQLPNLPKTRRGERQVTHSQRRKLNLPGAGDLGIHAETDPYWNEEIPAPGQESRRHS